MILTYSIIILKLLQLKVRLFFFMKSSIFSFILLFILTSCSSSPITSIYYIPHPDDDILSFGPSIIQDIESGNEVNLVLLTQGRASRAIHAVNERLEAEGYLPLTVEQFGQARVQEFIHSMISIGVTEEQIHILDFPDGSLTMENVTSVIEQFQDSTREEVHHTFTDLDPHHDHSITGVALREYKKKAPIDVRFYIPIQEHGQLEHLKAVELKTARSKKLLQQGLDAYGIWSPEKGFYAIGQSSVPEYFIRAREAQTSKWHD